MINFILQNLGNIWLILDIIWWILIFKFWIPENINREWHITLILEQEDEEEKKRVKKYDFYSIIWFYLLIGGFLLQLIWNLINK